jgi:purine-binding chemotaxis protein CheW
MENSLLIQLDPQKLRPSRLAETGMFRGGGGENA